MDTDFRYAFLYDAKFHGARFIRTALEGAKFDRADISGALFEPATVPSKSYVGGVKGAALVKFQGDANGGLNSSGLVLLRAAFREAGLRQQEREATYALERLKTAYLLGFGVSADGSNSWQPFWDRALKEPADVVHGLLRKALFEWTSGYGLLYLRPLGLLSGLLVFMTPIYAAAIWLRPRKVGKDWGIYKIWPRERLAIINGRPAVADAVQVERLHRDRWLLVLRRALYFSFLSAFHIGWRDLNVSSWIARLQTSEFVFRARGWVAFLSGVQSLVSVYLVALAVLVYFGRPFE
jgi:hypothetical protein